MDNHQKYLFKIWPLQEEVPNTLLDFSIYMYQHRSFQQSEKDQAIVVEILCVYPLDYQVCLIL
jgi:hypothetical protein